MFPGITDEQTYENELFKPRLKPRAHSQKQKINCHCISENSQQIPQNGQSSSLTITAVKRKGKDIVDIISLSKMIRLRKGIRLAARPVEIFEFDVKKMEWSDIAHAVKFNVEKEQFGQGDFRAAFKATSCNANFKDKVWVLI